MRGEDGPLVNFSGPSITGRVRVAERTPVQGASSATYDQWDCELRDCSIVWLVKLPVFKGLEDDVRYPEMHPTESYGTSSTIVCAHRKCLIAPASYCLYGVAHSYTIGISSSTAKNLIHFLSSSKDLYP